MAKSSRENKEKPVTKKSNGSGVKKNESNKLSDAEKVTEYMKKLKHPLKDGIEAVRTIIKNTDEKLEERIKWNAPSYHYEKQDLVTFNAWASKQVHLVFHHPDIVKIKSDILKGDYPTRRMVYFTDMKEVKANKKELEKILTELIKKIK